MKMNKNIYIFINKNEKIFPILLLLYMVLSNLSSSRPEKYSVSEWLRASLCEFKLPFW